jgi:hypothetical protein
MTGCVCLYWLSGYVGSPKHCNLNYSRFMVLIWRVVGSPRYILRNTYLYPDHILGVSTNQVCSIAPQAYDNFSLRFHLICSAALCGQSRIALLMSAGHILKLRPRRLEEHYPLNETVSGSGKGLFFGVTTFVRGCSLPSFNSPYGVTSILPPWYWTSMKWCTGAQAML